MRHTLLAEVQCVSDIDVQPYCVEFVCEDNGIFGRSKVLKFKAARQIDGCFRTKFNVKCSALVLVRLRYTSGKGQDYKSSKAEVQANTASQTVSVDLDWVQQKTQILVRLEPSGATRPIQDNGLQHSRSNRWNNLRQLFRGSASRDVAAQPEAAPSSITTVICNSTPDAMAVMSSQQQASKVALLRKLQTEGTEKQAGSRSSSMDVTSHTSCSSSATLTSAPPAKKQRVTMFMQWLSRSMRIEPKTDVSEAPAQQKSTTLCRTDAEGVVSPLPASLHRKMSSISVMSLSSITSSEMHSIDLPSPTNLQPLRQAVHTKMELPEHVEEEQEPPHLVAPNTPADTSDPSSHKAAPGHSPTDSSTSASSSCTRDCSAACPANSKNTGTIPAQLQQRIQHTAQLVQQAAFLGPQRQAEYLSSLHQLLEGEEQEEQVLTTMVDSILCQVEPYDMGTPQAASHYLKTIQPACITVGAECLSPKPCPSPGGRSLMSQQQTGQQLQVAVRVQYAEFDQISIGADTSCTCIAVEVARWYDAHPGQLLDTATFGRLMLAGADRWHAMLSDAEISARYTNRLLDFALVQQFLRAQDMHLHTTMEGYAQICASPTTSSGSGSADSSSSSSSSTFQQLVDVMEPGAYVLLCNDHCVAAAVLPNGRVQVANSLGRSLQCNCHWGHILEFDSQEEFGRVYTLMNQPAGVAAQVEVHGVSQQQPACDEPAFHVFST